MQVKPPTPVIHPTFTMEQYPVPVFRIVSLSSSQT